MPFRESHGIVAGLVREPSRAAARSASFAPEELAAHSEHLDDEVHEVLAESLVARVEGQRGRDVAGPRARSSSAAPATLLGGRWPRAALPAGFYARPALDVARDLVGCVVLHGARAGVIVETEAYHESEPACHAYAGLTPRTACCSARRATPTSTARTACTRC